MAGLYYAGLDYAGVEIVMRRMGIDGQLGDEIFFQLQVLEDEERVIRNRAEAAT